MRSTFIPHSFAKPAVPPPRFGTLQDHPVEPVVPEQDIFAFIASMSDEQFKIALQQAIEQPVFSPASHQPPSGQPGADGAFQLLQATRHNDYRAFHRLMAQPDIRVNEPDATGATPLHWAARYANAGFVYALLQKMGLQKPKPEVNGYLPQWVALEMAEQMPDYRKAYEHCIGLIERHVNVVRQQEAAAQAKDPARQAAWKALYEQRDVPLSRPPLVVAAEQGDETAMIQWMLAGEDLNQADRDEHRTPLQTAIFNGQLGAVKLLLRQPGLKIDHLCRGEGAAQGLDTFALIETCLQTARAEQQDPLYEDNGPSLQAYRHALQESYARLALYVAESSPGPASHPPAGKATNLAPALLDPALQRRWTQTTHLLNGYVWLREAMSAEPTREKQLLLQRLKEKLHEQNWPGRFKRDLEAIFAADRRSALQKNKQAYLQVLETFLTEKLQSELKSWPPESLHAANETTQRTLLHEAVKIGSVPLVRALLKQPGLNVNARDVNGCTPLILASRLKARTPEAARRRTKILEALLRHRSTDFFQRDQHGRQAHDFISGELPGFRHDDKLLNAFNQILKLRGHGVLSPKKEMPPLHGGRGGRSRIVKRHDPSAPLPDGFPF